MKRTGIIVLFFLAFLAGHFMSVMWHCSQPSYAASTQISFKVVPLSKVSDLEEALNEYGNQGWDLVEIDDGTGNIIFRLP